MSAGSSVTEAEFDVHPGGSFPRDGAPHGAKGYLALRIDEERGPNQGFSPPGGQADAEPPPDPNAGPAPKPAAPGHAARATPTRAPPAAAPPPPEPAKRPPT